MFNSYPPSRLIGIGVFALGLALFFALIPIGIDSPGQVSHMTLAPDFWPRIISALFALTGVLLCLRPGAPADNAENVDSSDSWQHRLPRLAVILAALFGFYFGINRFGMVVPGMLILFALMWFAGERRWRLMAGIAFGMPVLLYFFFTAVANIPIPLGMFEFLRG